MSNERAAFRAEVAEVERWWKVPRLISHFVSSRDQSIRALASQRQSAHTQPPTSSLSVAQSAYPIPPTLSPRRPMASSQNTLKDALPLTHMERTSIVFCSGVHSDMCHPD